MQHSNLTFIHGFMGHPTDWDDIRIKLQSCLGDFESHSVAIRKSTDWRKSVEQLAHSLDSRSIIVGYSMGARLALGVALEYPQKCKGLVFISGNPGLESDVERKKRWETDSRIAQRIEQEPWEQFLDGWYEQSVFSTLPIAIRKAEISRKLLNSSNEWAEVLRVNSVSKQPDYWPRLKELAMPALILAGENDAKYMAIAGRIDNETASNVNCEIVQNSGHIVHREQPDVVVKFLRRFIESIKTGATESKT